MVGHVANKSVIFRSKTESKVSERFRFKKSHQVIL